MKDAISANIVFEFVRYSNDNAEETSTKGSVETVRILPENGKDTVQTTTDNGVEKSTVVG